MIYRNRASSKLANVISPVFLFVVSLNGSPAFSETNGAYSEGAPEKRELLSNLSTTESNLALVEKAYDLDWGDVADGYQLAIDLVDTQFHAGESIVLWVFIRRASNDDQVRTFSDVYRMFVVEIVDSRGQSPPLTLYGKLRIDALRTSYTRYRFRPGDTLRFGYPISLTHDLSMIGDYTVTVKAPNPPRSSGWSSIAQSPPLTFEITTGEMPIPPEFHSQPKPRLSPATQQTVAPVRELGFGDFAED